MKCKFVASYISSKLFHLWHWTYDETLLVKHKIKLTVDVIYVTGFRKETSHKTRTTLNHICSFIKSFLVNLF